MELIRQYRRKHAIKSYLKKLPGLLARDYGKSKTYTPRQVKMSIERGGLSTYDACYGIALFSERAAFDHYHRELGESCDYDGMRQEIADRFFQGNCDFDFSTLSAGDTGGGWDAGIGDLGGSGDGGGGGGGD